MKKKYVTTCIVIICVILMFTYANAENQTAIVMATIHPPDSPEGKLAAMIYAEAFRRVGMRFVSKQYPPKRATVMAEKGEVDGEMTRAYGYQSHVTHLIRIEEPLYAFRLSAFAHHPDIRFEGKGYERLKGTSYRIDYRRGLKAALRRLSEFVTPSRLYAINTAKQGVQKLILGRCDLYADLANKVDNVLAMDEFKQAGVREVLILEASTVNGYLNEKHKALVPRMGSVFRQMKEEGLIAEYQRLARSNQD